MSQLNSEFQNRNQWKVSSARTKERIRDQKRAPRS